MQKISLQNLMSDMILAKDVYDANGRKVLIEGTCLNAHLISRMQKWDIRTVYIVNPLIDLPKVEEAVSEQTRLRALKVMQDTFKHTRKTKRFNLSKEHDLSIKEIVREVIQNRNILLHLTQIHRHYNDILSHSVNVAILSALTAVTMGMYNSELLYSLTLGAMLHDIGKTLIPEDILDKQEEYTDEELRRIKWHPELSTILLQQDRKVPKLVARIAREHHERNDGNGYPNRIEGPYINPLAKIVAVADTYDNLITDRPAKRGLEACEAYEIMIGCSNVMFDPAIIEPFLSKIALYPVGSIVKLSSGHFGIIVDATSKLQHRPVVKLVAYENGVSMSSSSIIDLSLKENMTIFIEKNTSEEELTKHLIPAKKP